MLTITFNPHDPLDALESCAAFAELLGDYIGQRRPDLDIPERASAAVSALCEAIAQAQDRAVSALLAEKLKRTIGFRSGLRRSLRPIGGSNALGRRAHVSLLPMGSPPPMSARRQIVSPFTPSGSSGL